MFGYVTTNFGELTDAEKNRYGAVYCGICRQIRLRASGPARLGLSYDMAFLALLLMSLYEPEEQSGKNGCMLHPIKRRPWLDNEIIRYCADMNVALAYYNFLDDWQDDRKLTARAMAGILGGHMERIQGQWPRQCAAIARCIGQIAGLERENCPNPDAPAGAFGELMGELLVYREDLWASWLRSMGDALGRFIYLMDGVQDYDQDRKRGKYNPFLAMGAGKNEQEWENILVLTMGRCTDSFEKLPLVQDKPLLNNILYSGVWVTYRNRRKENNHAGRSL